MVFGSFPWVSGRLSDPLGLFWSLCFCGGVSVDETSLYVEYCITGVRGRRAGESRRPEGSGDLWLTSVLFPGRSVLSGRLGANGRAQPPRLAAGHAHAHIFGLVAYGFVVLARTIKWSPGGLVLCLPS